MWCCILYRKLGFLQRLSSPCNKTIDASVFAHLREQEPGPLIIQQYNLLEQVYNTNLTSTLLEGSESHRIMKYGTHAIPCCDGYSLDAILEYI